ncbi:acyltransferase family protein [Fibrobacter succinogenes]|uniref:acyltransferase family protein n=1 Tax=Fibrobacter succinogenes TaxID=833 RepID=UPI00156965F4|nr:acyltransferase family protein [Fibrobacter succinogenes]
MPSNIAIDILPILLLFLCIFGAKITKPLSSINSKDYLSLATCKSYRGLFAILVILLHLAQRTESGVLFRYFTFTGMLPVPFFFFLSGYGLQKSYIVKSDKYRNGFLLKRVPTVLIPYIIIRPI